MIRRIFWLAAIPALLSGSAWGKEPESPLYQTVYFVSPQIDAADREIHPFEPWKPMFSQRLLFATLARLNDPLVETATGKTLIPAGEQFFKVAVEGPNLWCQANLRADDGSIARKLIGQERFQYCVIDSNADGRFESFFRRTRTVEFLPSLRGIVPKMPGAVGEVAMTRISPEQLESDYRIGLLFIKTKGQGEAARPVMQVFAGRGDDRHMIGVRLEGRPGEQQTYSFRDPPMTLETTSGPTGVSGRVLRGIPAGPTIVQGVDCGSINGC